MSLSRKQLAMLHVALRELALAEDEYRAILRGWVPSGSARDLAADDFEEVLDRFRELGFRPQRARALDYGPGRPGMASDGQLGFLWDLWMDYTGGHGTEQSLGGWLEASFGVSHARFLTPRQGRDAIGALRTMVARKGGDRQRRQA